MLLNNDVSLRPATTADWSAIEALLLANTLPTEGVRGHLGNYILGVRNGDIFGCGGAEVYGDIALLRSVAVAPGVQRQGIGRLLVERLLQEAQRWQIRDMFLLTVTAPEYFVRQGFRHIPIHQAPAALKASAEFQGACPASAVFMSLTLVKTKPATATAAGTVGMRE